MGETTAITWTHATFNPWWGCDKVSPGCTFCYAEKDAKRYGHDVWGKNAGRRFFGDKHWNDPLRWNRAAEKEGRRRRVFCASMADVFEDRTELDFWRVKLWKLIAETPMLDWLLLTKRPENIARMYPQEWMTLAPLNVWLGVTAENQEWYTKRVPYLMSVPAVVKFISYEPAIGRITFDAALPVDWIIVGGESGAHARPFELAWARDTIRYCRDAGVSCFVKQMGSLAVIKGCVADLQADFKDYKGGDPTEWPAELRVQQFPDGSHAPEER